MAHVEFFYDLSSPWTRLAFANIQPILAETGATITWRPFLVGGVFNAANSGIYERRADASSRAQQHSGRWLSEWAQLAGTAMHFPSAFHPLRSVAAMRFCCALEHDQAGLERFSDAAFDAYFGQQRNLDDPAELIAVANASGFDGEALAALCATQPIKEQLRANTEEAIARGAYGSPTLFVDGEHMYFGNDQLPLVRQRLLGQAG